mmetsp:Transcript_20363/g.27533  ORF Transcript_20363/g.27533 Transcript_20363/m.27533 type:complete len:125 (+) Transcript_20363:1095-1469(+)
MLFFVIYVQAQLFWILEKGNEFAVYQTKPLNGFFSLMLDSYKMAVGDFGPIVDNFEKNTNYLWLYGIIFVFGSIMSLIILLNMVIAIMSMSLENVILDQDALIIRERLIECINSHHRMPKSITS